MNILNDYLDDLEIDLIKDNYSLDYIDSIINSEYVLNNINLLLKYKLNFLGDILYYYLNILCIPTDILDSKLNILINIIGKDYVNIINNNIELLEILVND